MWRSHWRITCRRREKRWPGTSGCRSWERATRAAWSPWSRPTGFPSRSVCRSSWTAGPASPARRRSCRRALADRPGLPHRARPQPGLQVAAQLPGARRRRRGSRRLLVARSAQAGRRLRAAARVAWSQRTRLNLKKVRRFTASGQARDGEAQPALSGCPERQSAPASRGAMNETRTSRSRCALFGPKPASGAASLTTSWLRSLRSVRVSRCI